MATVFGFSMPGVAREEEVVFGKQAAQPHSGRDGSRGVSNNARRSTPNKDRRDAEAQFVHETRFGHLAVPVRSALTEHNGGTPPAKFAKDCPRPRYRHWKADNFGIEISEPRGIRLLAGNDERASIISVTVVRGGAGKGGNGRIEGSAGCHDRQARTRGTARAESLLHCSLIRARGTVTLSAGGPGCDQDPVAAGPNCAEYGPVRGSSEVAAEAVDRGGAVHAGDHVDDDPRPVRRYGPRFGRVDVERVDILDPGGKNLLHWRRPYRFGPVIVGRAEVEQPRSALSTAKEELVDRNPRNPQLTQTVIHFSSTSKCL